ncbi:MAG: malto-oligosyltrehalose trehalohydrolase [Planctomycetota bacterium]
MTSDAKVTSLPPCGAMLNADETCRWRVWAPTVREVQLILFDDLGRQTAHLMKPAKGGYFEFQTGAVPEGQRYAFQLDWLAIRPDPASRWQPEGVHQPSAVWNSDFHWSDQDWHGINRQDLVIYELHVGTLTTEGTFHALIKRLEQLRDLGVTAIELMPVGQFPGSKNWGYDGTYWYAVQNSYGGPRELQKLVDACHRVGLAVILDVVYNHLGPEGNYLSEFGPYFTKRVHTPWGQAVNFDEEHSEEVRAFVLNNVRQWIRDFHIDGLRLDAIQQIHDRSDRHILAEIKAVADEEASKLDKQIQVIAECDRNNVRNLWDQSDTGHGLDAQWNDDFHHCVHTLVTHEQFGYYTDFTDPLPQLEKVLNRVFAYDGNYSRFRGHRHGAPAGDLSGDRFVVSIQTHDQIGNRAHGDRLSQLVPFNRLRMSAALLLLSPYIPLLFMGEEYGESNPFPFFCDFGDAHLREAVRQGRRRDIADFLGSAEMPDPLADSTFTAAQLSWDWAKNEEKSGLRRLYHDLLNARRSWPALQDFEHRQAQLIPAVNHEQVLKIVRGNPSRPAEQIEAYFNPSAGTVTLPPPTLVERSILLRTDDRKYGGGEGSGISRWDLAPFECVIVQRRQDKS